MGIFNIFEYGIGYLPVFWPRSYYYSDWLLPTYDALINHELCKANPKPYVT